MLSGSASMLIFYSAVAIKCQVSDNQHELLSITLIFMCSFYP